MSLLKSMRKFEIVRQGNLEKQMWDALSAESFTHLFLDCTVPGLSIPDALKRIKDNYPAMNVIIINSSCNFFLTQRMIGYGARAVISKNTGTNELDFCLHSINAGRRYISQDIRLIMNEHANVARPLNFTDKEIQVLQFIAKGYTINKTAAALNLSKHTIVTHRRNMMDKSGLTSATGLVKFGIDAGLISI